MTLRTFAAASVALVMATAASTAAWAHAHLVQSDPAANATLAASPKAITLTFSEKLTPAFSTFQLSMPDHGMKVAVKTKLSADGKSIVGTPSSALMSGGYKLVWTAAGPDGHKMTGQITFTVG